MNLQSQTATELKQLAAKAMSERDRQLVEKIKAEVLRRANKLMLAGKATESLIVSTAKLASR